MIIRLIMVMTMTLMMEVMMIVVLGMVNDNSGSIRGNNIGSDGNIHFNSDGRCDRK